MNNKNERQHYVSRVLLERFKIPNSPLECYQVQTGEWKQIIGQSVVKRFQAIHPASIQSIPYFSGHETG
jgi:hypothetical protein